MDERRGCDYRCLPNVGLMQSTIKDLLNIKHFNLLVVSELGSGMSSEPLYLFSGSKVVFTMSLSSLSPASLFGSFNHVMIFHYI